MSNAPEISFALPCYNYGRYLPDCLASIFAQQGGHEFEIIAIDDASTDNTAQVLRDFHDPRMRVIHHERNLGHVAAMNRGVSEARGAFIARIDPDDRYRPGFLSTVLSKFEEFPELGLVYGDAALIDESGQVNVERSDQAHSGRDFKGNEFIRLLEKNIICAPTAIARREAWHKVMPIPAGLAFNDWYLNIMMARHYDFYYVNRVVADYRVHSSNHHNKIVRDRSEEPSILQLLDRVFQERETRSDLEAQKRKAKGRIYSAQYVTLADKYFGLEMNADARRCYLQAIRNRPACLISPGVQRRLAATLIGRTRYEFGKSLIRSVLARS
jgi:glycosyltransferase involved in cell wall biosynthesis